MFVFSFRAFFCSVDFSMLKYKTKSHCKNPENANASHLEKSCQCFTFFIYIFSYVFYLGSSSLLNKEHSF